LLNNLHLIF